MWELLAGVVVWTMIGGVFPVVNAEVMVVVSAAAASSVAAPAIALAATLGQMTAKTGLFLTARWAPSRLPGRARAALNRGVESIRGHRLAAGTLILVSAVLGMPPFYGVSIAAGALGVRWQTFVVLGSTGRAVRFGILAWAGRRFGGDALDLLASSVEVAGTLIG